jgi:hypothetical protein
MPSTKHLKVKERLALTLYIKNLNKEVNPYVTASLVYLYDTD